MCKEQCYFILCRRIDMTFQIANKVVLVTGGANGIGASTARNFLAEGAKHVAILDVAETKGIEFQNELNTKYGAKKSKFYKCDVTNENHLFAVYKSIFDDQGYIDVVINNAGIVNENVKHLRKVIEVNVIALVTSSLKALELMRKDNGGRGGTIINISSVAALHISSIYPVYFTTKSAVLQFGNCLGSDEYYSRSGVRVLTLCFGLTDTGILQNVTHFDKKIEETLPERVKLYTAQKVETASKSLLEAYKSGENGSIWLSIRDQPVKEITDTVRKAYGILENLLK